MSNFRLTLGANFQVNMGVVQLKVKGEINDLAYGVETKVKAQINQDV